MADKALTQDEIDEVLSLLDLGPLMYERAEAAIARADAEDVRKISSGLSKARERSANFRQRAEVLKTRLAATGVLSDEEDRPRLRSLAEARAVLSEARSVSAPTMTEEPNFLFNPLFLGSATLSIVRGDMRALAKEKRGKSHLAKEDEETSVVFRGDVTTEEADDTLEGIEQCFLLEPIV